MLTLGEVDRIYQTSAIATVQVHVVTHHGFEQFFRHLTRLNAELGDDRNDLFWQDLLWMLRRFAYSLSVAPIPFSFVSRDSDRLATAISKTTATCSRVYPNHLERLQQVASDWESLRHDASNPYLTAIADAQLLAGRDAIVINDSQLISSTEAAIEEFDQTERATVVSPRQLCGGTTFDNLFGFGPTHWYPRHIWTAPRAPAICWLRYQFMRGEFDCQPEFALPTNVSSGDRCSFIGYRAAVTLDSSPNQVRPMLVDPDFLRPLVVLPETTNAVQSVDGSENSEYTIATPCLLEGGYCAWLDCSEGARVVAIDLALDEKRRVSRIAVADLEPGMFLLLRTSGGGDYIAPLADRILGINADRFRAFQRLWKTELRRFAKEHFGYPAESGSLRCFAEYLTQQGAHCASPVSVAYWMSSKCIQTRERDDFYLLMRVAGLSEDADNIWAAMKTIDRAHRRAGHMIRQMLLKKVQSEDLTELQKYGRLDIKLSTEDSAQLSAFRIVHLPGGQQDNIAISRIGVPMALEGESWPA